MKITADHPDARHLEVRDRDTDVRLRYVFWIDPEAGVCEIARTFHGAAVLDVTGREIDKIQITGGFVVFDNRTGKPYRR